MDKILKVIIFSVVTKEMKTRNTTVFMQKLVEGEGGSLHLLYSGNKETE